MVLKDASVERSLSGDSGASVTMGSKAKGKSKGKAKMATKKKPAAKTSTKKPPKAVSKKALTAARRDVASDDPGIQASARRIIAAWDLWQQMNGKVHDVSKTTREAIGGAEASFRETIERGQSIEGSADEKEEDARTKLADVTMKWQSWQEEIAGAAEDRKAAKKERREAQKALERAIEEGRQLVLPGVD